MMLNRISRLVRMAAVDSGVPGVSSDQLAGRPVAPGLFDRQAQVLTGSGKAPSPVVAMKLGARVALPRTNLAPGAATQDDIVSLDPLLPPEGPGQGGQTPAPVIIATGSGPAPARPAPSPIRAPAPIPAPSPIKVAPAPVSAVGPAPAPYRAPAPLGPVPWQNQPGPVVFAPMPSAPVLRQPVLGPAVPGFAAPSGGSQGAQPSSGGDTPAVCAQPPPVPGPVAADSCCCVQVTALVASVAATSDAAITAITAITAIAAL